jgi:hypothetical protein
MACPLKRKSCKQAHIYRYQGGGWFCAGVLSRKPPDTPRFDVIRHCSKTTSAKGIAIIDMRPEEAALTSACIELALFNWFMQHGPYGQWYVENDET